MLIAVNYHYIRPAFDFKYPSIFGITPSKFRKQLEALSAFGTFVSQQDILNHLDGHSRLPQNAIIITFDDGLAEQIDLALPILQEMGIPAIFFLNTRVLVDSYVLNVHKIHLVRSEVSPVDLTKKVQLFLKKKQKFIDKTEYQEKAIFHYKYDQPDIAMLKYLLNFILTVEERDELMETVFREVFDSEKLVHDNLYMNLSAIKKLASDGMLGSHSHDHFPLGTLSSDQQENQIGKSQQSLQQLIGKKTQAFSYPYGSFEACNAVGPLLEADGFRFAFTMERAKNENLEKSLYLSRFDNNDMPLGKAWKHGDKNPFEILPSAQWKFD
ncbi:MAG: hypothetical protein DHS20C18_24460 [Saprospiraceae bacterium]|nr:MAG: hypothetical protein DHS20C18_24460 [Saprospiraceae bacterium]